MQCFWHAFLKTPQNFSILVINDTFVKCTMAEFVHTKQWTSAGLFFSLFLYFPMPSLIAVSPPFSFFLVIFPTHAILTCSLIAYHLPCPTCTLYHIYHVLHTVHHTFCTINHILHIIYCTLYIMHCIPHSLSICQTLSSSSILPLPPLPIQYTLSTYTLLIQIVFSKSRTRCKPCSPLSHLGAVRTVS